MEINWTITMTTTAGPGRLSVHIDFGPVNEILFHLFPRKNTEERHWGYVREFCGGGLKSFGLGPLFSVQWVCWSIKD